MKSYLLGACYCKDKQGEPDRNDIMCLTNMNFETVDFCLEDEWCIGPKTHDKAKLFSRENFCAKGGYKILQNKLI